MDYIVKREERMMILPCECGEYPIFKHPNDGWTDTWLICPNCGKQTVNTGGFDYAHEIPLEEAKKTAISLWNKRELMT